MAEPLTICLAAFTAIKSAVSAGREIQSLGSDIGKLFDGIDAIRNDHNKAKSNPFKTANEQAMETFIAKKKAEDMENELRKIVVETRGFEAWNELIQMRIEVRQQRKEEALALKKKKQKFWDDVATITAIVAGVVLFGGVLVGVIFYLSTTGYI
jgi:hypothetical protein